MRKCTISFFHVSHSLSTKRLLCFLLSRLPLWLFHSCRFPSPLCLSLYPLSSSFHSFLYSNFLLLFPADSPTHPFHLFCSLSLSLSLSLPLSLSLLCPALPCFNSRKPRCLFAKWKKIFFSFPYPTIPPLFRLLQRRAIAAFSENAAFSAFQVMQITHETVGSETSQLYESAEQQKHRRLVQCIDIYYMLVLSFRL